MALSEKIKLCFALLAVHIVLSIFTVIPGHFSIDEVLYHMMTKNFIETGSFEIWNGYREFPSPELVFTNTPVHNGRLVSACPYLYPVLSAPFYFFWGYRGLFVLNSLAFIGVVSLTYGIGQKFFKNKNMSLNACLILSVGTYVWEYSQAAWPHMTSTFFVMAAFYFFLTAFYNNDPKKAFYSALSCGVISSLAIGIRLDSIFIFPCFIFAFIFIKPWQPNLFFGVIAGAIPGIVLLSATNYAKFGVLSPFSYGGMAGSMAGVAELTKYFPLVTLVFWVFFILWVATRYPVISGLKKHRIPTVFLLFILTLSFFLMPQIKSMVWKTLHGAYQLLVDFRIRDLELKEGGLSRSMGGGMVYLGGLKKSLLQSCPYLVILFIPLVKIMKCDKDRLPLILLFFIPLIYIGFYSYSGGWHGGMSLNLRYFIPILPFFSILTAFSWDRLTSGVTFPKNMLLDRLFVILFTIILMLFLYFQRTLVHPDVQEFYCLNLPLILASSALIQLLLWQMVRKKNWIFLCKTTIITLLVAMIWSGTMGFFYDYTYHRERRRFILESSILASEFISDNAILFTNQIDIFSHLIDSNKIRIANPFNDNFEDFSRLLAFHFQKGNDVYIAFHSNTWDRLQKMSLFDGYKIKHYKILKVLILGQVFDIPKTN